MVTDICMGLSRSEHCPARVVVHYNVREITIINGIMASPRPQCQGDDKTMKYENNPDILINI